jgi:hypothetical protein
VWRRPVYNAYTLSFSEDELQKKYQYYRVSTSFPFYAAAVFIFITTAGFCSVVYPGFDSERYGTSSQFVATLCLGHLFVGLTVLATGHSLVQKYFTDPEYLFAVRCLFQDLYILTEPLANGGLLLNRCYRGDCAQLFGEDIDSIPRVATGFCNPTGSGGMLPQDKVLSLVVVLCLNHILFRASSWSIIVITWLETLVVVSVGVYLVASHETVLFDSALGTVITCCICVLPINYVLDKNLADSFIMSLMDESSSTTTLRGPPPAEKVEGPTVKCVADDAAPTGYEKFFINTYEDSGQLGDDFIMESFGDVMRDLPPSALSDQRVDGGSKVSFSSLPLPVLTRDADAMSKALNAARSTSPPVFVYTRDEQDDVSELSFPE